MSFEVDNNKIPNSAVIKETSNDSKDVKPTAPAKKEVKNTNKEDGYLDTGELKDDTKDSYTIIDFKNSVSNNKKLDGLDDNFDYLKAFKTFDQDGDGLVSSEEIGKAATGHDDFDDFSLSEFQAVVNNGKNKKPASTGTSKKTSSKKQVTVTPNTTAQTPTTAANVTPTTVTPAATTVAPTTVSSAPITYTTTTTSMPSSGGNASAPETDIMSTNLSVSEKISKLQESKTTKEGELSDLNDDLSNALDGTDSEISKAKEDMDDAKEVYDDLLASEAEDNEEVKDLKDKKDKNDEAIKTNEEDTNEAEKTFNKKTQEVTEQETLISGLKGQKEAYDTVLDDLNNEPVTDANKSLVEGAIEDVQDEIDKLDEKIKKEEETLEDLETEKKESGEKIDSLKEERDGDDGLIETRDSIEEDLMDVVSSETKEALVAYQDARKVYEEDKEKRITAIKDDIEIKQDEITDIEEKIQTLEADKIKQEDRTNPMSLYDSEKGNSLAQAAIKRCNGNTVSGGKCGAGVGDSIEAAFGYDITQDGCDYDDVLSQRSDWIEITDLYPDAASMMGAYDPENGTGLPPGAVVSWSPFTANGTEHPYGHSYVADGEGMEYSDYIHEITTYFADNGATYRIFVPTGE